MKQKKNIQNSFSRQFTALKKAMGYSKVVTPKSEFKKSEEGLCLGRAHDTLDFFFQGLKDVTPDFDAKNVRMHNPFTYTVDTSIPAFNALGEENFVDAADDAADDAAEDAEDDAADGAAKDGDEDEDYDEEGNEDDEDGDGCDEDDEDGDDCDEDESEGGASPLAEDCEECDERDRDAADDDLSNSLNNIQL